MLTDEQLAKIEARANAATPGPWSVGDGQCIGLGVENHGPGNYSYDIELAEVVPSGDREPERQGAARQGRDYVVASPEADAEFIAAARSDVPALLAEVRASRVDAKDWHDTYQSEVNARDEFFGELLKLLPGAEDEGIDAYDQIPRGIERLRDERDRAQQRLDHLADLARTAENETYDYIVHDAVTNLINACKSTPAGGEGQC